LGYTAGASVTTGLGNTYIGARAGEYLIGGTTGNSNTIVGAYSRPSTAAGYEQILLGYNQVGGGNNTFKVGVAVNTATLALNGGAVTFTVSSDERLKDNITNSIVGLDFINDLRPVTYKWKAEKDVPIDMPHYKEGSDKPCKGFGKTHYGFIAQEVKAVIDNYNLVDGQTIHRVDPEGTQEVGMGELIPMLVKAIQELSAQNADLTTRITALEG
jgi:trimeric autotransporter adhesin